LTIADGCFDLIEAVQQQFRGSHGLVHRASVFEKDKTLEQAQAQWDLHLNSSEVLARAAEAARHPEKENRMIFFADWTTVSGRPHLKQYVNYYASTAALNALAEALALERAPKILVNVVAPGPI